MWVIFTSRVSGQGHRIGAVSVCVCLSTLTAKLFDLCVCVSVSIMLKGLSGKRTVPEGNAAGKSMLRRFHSLRTLFFLGWLARFLHVQLTWNTESTALPILFKCYSTNKSNHIHFSHLILDCNDVWCEYLQNWTQNVNIIIINVLTKPWFTEVSL